jgi:hypothetical protein
MHFTFGKLNESLTYVGVIEIILLDVSLLINNTGTLISCPWSGKKQVIRK